ncbi:hypothetical protein NDU88_007901 [Pleurodeles waltl]|uniref:Uncharacterized protein n=1 Tax=Pleurodeles waltl TaxID=8319 RepID=A0AAV7VVP9_PLEWA|nr:hypothetical protein NDU88_007901 [Pleurodeles waltl]
MESSGGTRLHHPWPGASLVAPGVARWGIGGTGGEAGSLCPLRNQETGGPRGRRSDATAGDSAGLLGTRRGGGTRRYCVALAPGGPGNSLKRRAQCPWEERGTPAEGKGPAGRAAGIDEGDLNVPIDGMIVDSLINDLVVVTAFVNKAVVVIDVDVVAVATKASNEGDCAVDGGRVIFDNEDFLRVVTGTEDDVRCFF